MICIYIHFPINGWKQSVLVYIYISWIKFDQLTTMRVNKGQWEYRDGQTDQTPDSPTLDSWNVNFMSTLILSFHIEHNFLHINFSLLSQPSTGMVPLFQHQKKKQICCQQSFTSPSRSLFLCWVSGVSSSVHCSDKLN